MCQNKLQYENGGRLNVFFPTKEKHTAWTSSQKCENTHFYQYSENN